MIIYIEPGDNAIFEMRDQQAPTIGVVRGTADADEAFGRITTRLRRILFEECRLRGRVHRDLGSRQGSVHECEFSRQKYLLVSVPDWRVDR